VHHVGDQTKVTKMHGQPTIKIHIFYV